MVAHADFIRGFWRIFLWILSCASNSFSASFSSSFFAYFSATPFSFSSDSFLSSSLFFFSGLSAYFSARCLNPVSLTL